MATDHTPLAGDVARSMRRYRRKLNCTYAELLTFIEIGLVHELAQFTYKAIITVRAEAAQCDNVTVPCQR